MEATEDIVERLKLVPDRLGKEAGDEIVRLRIIIDSYASSSAAAAREMNRLRDEICRIRTLTRLQDAVIRSHETACLTHEEREAVNVAAEAYEQNDDDDGCFKVAAALRCLLERDRQEIERGAAKLSRERLLNEKGLGSEPD